MTITDFFNRPYFYHSGSSLLLIDPNGFRLMSIDQPVPEIWQCKHLTKNDLEGQGQSTPFSIGFWRVPRYTFCANLEILARILVELSRRHARFCENWSVKVQNDLEGQGQSTPFSIASERVPRYTFCANLEILARILVELSRGHARFCENWSVKVQNDLEGQGQSTPFSIASERVPRYTFSANLEILARILVELSCGQASTYGQTDRRTDGQTDRRTDGGNDNTLRQNLPRGKNPVTLNFKHRIGKWALWFDRRLRSFIAEPPV